MNDPEVLPKEEPQQDISKVWIILTGFISIKGKGTQPTYLSVLREWTRFLGAESGTEEGADLLCKADDLHAMAWKNFLEEQPGQKPRFKRATVETKAVALSQQRLSQLRDGLQANQSNSTINKKFNIMRRLYRVLLSHKLVALNPFDADRVPPPPKLSGQKRPTEMVAYSKVKEVIESADVNTEKGLRDRAILCCEFGAGLRRGEVAKLVCGDVRQSQAGTTWLYLRATKKKKDDTAVLPAWAAEWVNKQLAARIEQGALKGDPLFPAYKGRGGSVRTNRPIGTTTLYDLFIEYCTVAGVENRVSPHSARATAITRLLDQGVDHRKVQEFSRHSSVQMVELYDKRRREIDYNPAIVLDYSDKEEDQE